MVGDQHYDVIIIGTGAGGGTLAHRLAPSGKRVLLLERGDYLPRERDNWESTAVFVEGKYRAPGVLARQARRRVPAGGQLLRRRQHQVLRRRAVPAAPAGLRRDPPPRRHLAGLADRLRRPSSRTTPRPSSSTWCTVGTVRTRPRAMPARSTRSRRCSTSRASRSSATQLEKQDLHPFHLPIGVNLHPGRARQRPPTPAPCIRCNRVDGFPCLLGAKSDAQVICVDPALDARQRRAW